MSETDEPVRPAQEDGVKAAPESLDAKPPTQDELFEPPTDRKSGPNTEEFESEVDFDNLFETYSFNPDDSARDDFGNLPERTAEMLEKKRIAVLYGDSTRLSDLASTVVARYLPKPARHLVFWSEPHGNFKRIYERIPIVELIKSSLLSKPFDSAAKVVLVIWDLHHPSFTPLIPSNYVDPAALTLFGELEKRPHLRVLVITAQQTWTRLTATDGTRQFTTVGLRLDPLLDTVTPAPAPGTLADTLKVAYDRFGKLGIWTAWCAVWMSTASMDGLVLCIEAMIAQWQPKERRREQAIEQWRRDWNDVIEAIKADHTQDRGMVRIQFLSDEWAAELRRQFRLRYRMQHIEALNLLRDSAVVEEAPVEVLQAMALFFSRLAREDAQPGKSILVHLIEQWLGNVAPDRTSFLLAEVFFSMVRDGDTEFASDALTQFTSNGYGVAVFEILRRCPPRLLNQEWCFLLYNRVLPQLRPEHRMALWSRMIIIGAAPQGQIRLTTDLASKHLSGHLQVQFVARVLEELLLGDHTRRPRLLEILREAVTDSASPGAWLFTILRSDDFRDFANLRAALWSLSQPSSTFFGNWLLMTVLPIVPSISPLALGHMLAHVLIGDAPLTRSTPTPLDVFITMLLVDYSFGDSPDEAWDATVPSIAGLAIRDKESAAASHAILRDLSDRFLSASRVLARLSPTETVLDLQAADAIRHFFDQKSEIAYRLSKVIENQFLTE